MPVDTLLNISYLLPEIFMGCSSILLLGYGCIITKFSGKYYQFKKVNYLTMLVLFLSGLLFMGQLGFISNSSVLVLNGLLFTNEFVTTIKIILVMSSVIILILGNDSLLLEKIYDYEFSQLILLSVLGMCLLISSNDFIILYLSVELLSLSFYVLASIKRDSLHSTEAGLKYFLLGALSSGLLLFGMGLIYSFTGSTSFEEISMLLWYNNSDLEIIIGAIFIFIALLFKVAAAPFHQWIVDVYEGSPTIVTAFFAIVPKIAILGVIINLVTLPFLSIFSEISPLLCLSAVLSLLIGSIGALNQAKLKRLLAYSAVTHIGFLLIGILPNSLISIQGTFIYIFLYIIMSFSSFTFVLSTFKTGNYISQLSGLSRYNPILAFTFAFTLLSIAGVPPLAGFYSKYLILFNAIDSGFYAIAVIGIISSCIATFYYLRIIKWMFFKDTNYFHMKDIGDCLYPINTQIKVSFSQSLILGSTSWLILTLLIFPSPLITFSSNILISSLI